MAEKRFYQISQKIPFQADYRYCCHIGKEEQYASRKRTLILAVVMFAGALAGILLKISFVALFCMIMGVLYLVFNDVFFRKAVRKRYKDNEMLSTGEQKLSFFKDSFSVKWDKEKGEYPYHKLHKVIEEKDAFYLMVNEKAGQIVMKNACSEDLQHFLRGMAEETKYR